MKNYIYYRENRTVIGMKLTKGTYKEVFDLITKHGASQEYTADRDKCEITFTQQWPREGEQTIKRGMYITSENYGLKVYSPYDFRNRFTRIYKMSDWYSPTADEVKIIECLHWDAELCYGYDWICDTTKLTRTEAKAAIDNLRDMGVVTFWRGLMTEEGEVAGSGFCIGDRYKAEALLYRYYGDGKNKE